jgi:hypothetical protein
VRATLLRLALAGAVLLGGAIVLDRLADATQTRSDAPVRAARTEVVVDVDTNRYRQTDETAASALWGVCAATVPVRLVGGAPERLTDGSFRYLVEPALGRYRRERLLGCLNDLTLDRVRAEVVRVDDIG